MSPEGVDEFRRFFAGIGIHDRDLQFRLALLGATAWNSSGEMLEEAHRRGMEKLDLAQLAGFAFRTRLGRPDLETSGLPLVGFAFSGSYRHQLLPLARSIHASGRFRAVAILDLREWNAHGRTDLAPFMDIPCIALADPALMADLTAMAAVFSPDTGYRFLEHLPKNVKRVALMHGIIADPEYTISHEGGGTHFDHILLPGACKLREDAIMDIFPRSMVRHGSEHLELVPAGWPKLDEMIEASARSGGVHRRKVVVHLSVESHDSAQGMRLLPDLVDRLLSRTPAIEVVFRPFPGIDGGFGQSVASRFQGRDGFRISTGESYVDDYAGASALVTLKETTAELVSLAWGVPAFCLSPESKPGDFARGRIFSDADLLLRSIDDQLASPDRWRTRIFAERDRTYNNVGTSTRAVLEALPRILSGEPVAGATRLGLFSGRTESDLEEATRSLRSLALSPFHATREFSAGVVSWSVRRFPLEPEVLLWSAANLENIHRRNQSVALGRRIGPQHFVAAELFLVAHCGLLLLGRIAPLAPAEITDRKVAQTQAARQMVQDLQRVVRTLDDYRFDALQAIADFLLDPASEPAALLDALEAMPLRHPNQPFHPGDLARAIRQFLTNHAVGSPAPKEPSPETRAAPRASASASGEGKSSDFDAFLAACRALAPTARENSPELFGACLLAWGEKSGTDGFLRSYDDLDGHGRTVFRELSGRLASTWTPGRIKVATWIHPEVLASQLLPIGQSLQADSRFHHATVASGRLQPQSLDGLKSFLGGDFLYAWREEWLDELVGFDAMVGGEANIDASGFPRQVKRFLQPHGLDAPIHHSMLHFGAGTVYDHILCPSLDERLQHGLDANLYRQIFPPILREHASAEVQAIPAGYAKLDKFCSAVAGYGGACEKIVYHLSNWGLEEPFVHANAERILGQLLDAFPDRTIVFRPMPKDLAHPDIVRILRSHAGHPRLEVSTADSYIDDYLRAAILVHHRSSSADVFALATRRPVVLVRSPDSGSASNPYGPVARSVDEIIPLVRQALERSGIPPASGSGQIPPTSPPGGSTAYILDCIEDACRGRRRPEWLALPLGGTHSEPDDLQSLLRAAFTAFVAGVPFRAMARRMVRLHPSSRTFHLLASAGLQRDGHPDHYPEYARTWLEALECLAKGLSLPVEDPASPLEARLMAWVGQELPQLVETLDRKLPTLDDAGLLERFRTTLGQLQGLGTGGAPRPSARGEAEAMRLVEEGIDLFEAGDAAAARTRFLQASRLVPGEGTPFIGLAHCAIRLKDRAAFQQARRELASTPDGPRTLPEIDRLAEEAFGSFER